MHKKLKRLVKEIEAAGESRAPIRTADLAELEMIAEDLALYVADWVGTLLRDMGPDADVKEEFHLLHRYHRWMLNNRRLSPPGAGRKAVPWPKAKRD